MHISDLPDRTQDYLKSVYDLQEWGSAVTLTVLAEKMGQKKSTTSEAVKRLVAQELVEHAPYGDVQLTELGHSLALMMVRRHRMIETYLCTQLDYSTDEVHEEAEVLEHAVSDRFLDKISELMGHPTRDPHGDPIPDADGQIHTPETLPLEQVETGEVVYVDRVSDRDAELLRYLQDNGIVPGAQIEMKPRAFADMAAVHIIATDSTIQLPASSLNAVLCRNEADA